MLAAQSASQPFMIGATVRSASMLRTSGQVLSIPRLTGPGIVSAGSVDFDAKARTWTGGEVILTVEALRSPDQFAAPSGGGDVAIEFSGSEPGIVSGVLSTAPQVAARWTGSGVRRGRLTFTVRTSAGLEGGELPLRFVLSLP